MCFYKTLSDRKKNEMFYYLKGVFYGSNDLNEVGERLYDLFCSFGRLHGEKIYEILNEGTKCDFERFESIEDYYIFNVKRGLSL